MADKIFQIALTLIDSVGPVTARLLVSYCGGAEAVFRQKSKNLLRIPGIGPKTVKEILDKEVLLRAEKEMHFLENYGYCSYFYLDENYPSRLRAFNDSPVMIFYHGNANLNHPRTLGMVGTRKPSSHGIDLCEKIIAGLRDYDVLLVSGLAYGIDGISHRRALEEGIPTIGVMGSGLGRIYPPAHKKLAIQMTGHGGLLTEFHAHAKPEKEHFPMRNRIIAALSDAVVVVESAKKGGSMITAQFAFGYNKDVFAVPGRPGDQMSAGPNHLIKTNVASLAENAGDIAYRMLWEQETRQKSVQLGLFPALTEVEEKLLSLFHHEPEGIPTVDQLHYLSGLGMNELSALLLELECKNLIKSIPGSRYRII